jgi:hypothetical protein
MTASRPIPEFSLYFNAGLSHLTPHASRSPGQQEFSDIGTIGSPPISEPLGVLRYRNHWESRRESQSRCYPLVSRCYSESPDPLSVPLVQFRQGKVPIGHPVPSLGKVGDVTRDCSPEGFIFFPPSVEVLEPGGRITREFGSCGGGNKSLGR